MKIKAPFLFTLPLLIFFFTYTISFAQAQSEPFIYGDLLPDAPELAAGGEYSVGVRTLDFVNENQLDILNYGKGDDSLYNRPLKVEVWYPSKNSNKSDELISYDEVMGQNGSPTRPIIPFTFLGRASRDANPLYSDGSFPLVIVSHGYTGSRYLMTYLTENLASKGYVVVAIDHTEATFRDAAGFQSTLLNRSLDDLFVLNEMARLEKDGNSFLKDLVDTENTALIGYSMGGYGAVNVAGAGYSPQAAQLFGGMTGGSNALLKRTVGNPEFEASIDPRIKVIVAFAPWGMQRGVWNAEGLAGIKIPSLFIAGSKDDISGYEDGTKAIYDGAINSERYLLTFIEARHNVAPNPAPKESLNPELDINEYLRYADSVWDSRRMNNINQHFVTAFLGKYLKGESSYQKYLDVNADPEAKEWPGFKPRTTIGLEMDQKKPNN
ncbi:alpha/beta hydrolase family protein [Algoriphagus machipongonensis]|uniref:Platelet-activating factor acetylhydrolase, plasma/intracellular isoform II n=1 Tax=Algoriphagus machipongonensis TaxID=388413 RepID=A3HYP2_9BACT|nr:alpha/beta fold hydrolase [Algoriphagus machipongonensis]EAZ80378.1 platelet-activating factor acetylhydrolase, plasma/intracellular isoform II [Algoriphagus machipongonensis]